MFILKRMECERHAQAVNLSDGVRWRVFVDFGEGEASPFAAISLIAPCGPHGAIGTYAGGVGIIFSLSPYSIAIL